MSKILRDLLNAKEPLFSLSLRQLEAASGRGGTDARLIGEIHTKAAAAIRALGLDPTDSTGQEIYRALLNLTSQHDERLANAIGARDTKDANALTALMKAAVEKSDVNMQAWVLKQPVAKEMLRKMPPRKVMQHLGYRSVESMLKHEKLGEIYGALRFAETPEWLEKFNQQYVKLKPSDFESKKITFVVMSPERWADAAEGFIKKKRHNITHLKELGVILILPFKTEAPRGLTITALPLLFHYINEIRLYSAFFKLQQVKPNFGEIIAETLLADPATAGSLAGQNVHWRVIQRYFGKLENENHPEIFEPHVQPEDLHWRKAEESIYKIAPELKFWQDMDYVGVMRDGRPVSFNLMDTAVSYSNDTPYKTRAIYHLRESLWNEIFMRYMGHKNLENQILKELDNDMIAPEKLEVGINE